MPAPISDEAERLFFEIIDLPATEREAYLDAAARNAPDLRAEVASLLNASEHGERMLSGAIGKMAASFLPEVGTRIGSYRLVRLIGEGGMGVVFLAERADGHFDQQVAIKFVHGGSMAVARFLQERQILARLVHPNIARLVDGGITEDGAPYMVMEYFPGEPLSRYCRNRDLPITQRLRLFQQVCSAVDHAHRSLIIHRDLKPSNILVNEHGELKLLDFGIAKLLHHTPEEALTAEGGNFFTPDYASPEQIRGEPITTATDVYSLGAVLFELLSGAGPHRLEKYTPAEITQVVCEDPSPALNLGDELDQIVQMALRKEPERRYPSVNHLSEDIERFLTQQPVRASADTFGYRARKFIRRNSFAVAAALAALVCLLAGSGLAIWQARVARREAAAAERRFQQVRKVARIMLFDLEKQMRSLKGAMPARELLTKTALEYLDSLYADAQQDLSLRREMAIAYERIGDVQGERGRPNLGQRGEAIRNYTRSGELWDGVPERERDFVAYARVHFKLYDLAGGDALSKALAATERAGAIAPGEPGTYQILIRRERLLGTQHLLRGEAQQAIERNARALALAEEWMAKMPEESVELFVSGALESLSSAYLFAGQPALAISASERVAAIRERFIRAHPQDPHHWRQLFRSHLVRARALGHPRFVNLGRDREASSHYQRAIEIGERLLVEDPLNAVTKTDLAEAYSGLADVLTDAPARAEALQQKAITLYANVVKGSRVAGAYRDDLALGHLGMARITYRHRQRDKAGRHLDESIRITREIANNKPSLPELRHDLLEPLALRIHISLDTGRNNQAESDLRECLAILSTIKPGPSFRSNRPDMADVFSAAGRFHRNRNRALSLDYYRKSLALWDELRQSRPLPSIAMQKRQQVVAELARF